MQSIVPSLSIFLRWNLMAVLLWLSLNFSSVFLLNCRTSRKWKMFNEGSTVLPPLSQVPLSQRLSVTMTYGSVACHPQGLPRRHANTKCRQIERVKVQGLSSFLSQLLTLRQGTLKSLVWALLWFSFHSIPCLYIFSLKSLTS